MPSFDEKPLTTSVHPPADSTTSSSDNLPRVHLSPAHNYFASKEGSLCPPNGEFDPCQTSNPCSPFYNHDTPRGSMDNFKSKTSLHVSVRDLEAQNGLTPSQTNDPRPSPADGGALKPWTTNAGIFGREKSRCLTKPKQRGCHCMSNLPKRQKFLIKLLIALVIVGAMVGIGVGISLRVGGGVYKDENSTAKIGNV
ncbi:hypothetical protein EPUS_00197 [Endocarpon pusillum Z07020]|uniref:Uncharacterized protein n=1 Tax=Endocarpon pusillum (strain Z07020 / HMAS-L-300199) TaxID=1263415 RepID=U1I0K3_ENDPU|nr:uncharacterized protein EPUS_00197 [Endocarpon pusillum Z07020]ERF75404.1 hypothetical protein EPUS_00197 [Endocarpon pusillum Z07020]